MIHLGTKAPVGESEGVEINTYGTGQGHDPRVRVAELHGWGPPPVRGGQTVSGSEYSIGVNEGEVVLDIIHRLQATQTPDLAVRWNCKAGKCGGQRPPALAVHDQDEHVQPRRDDHRHPDARVPGDPGPRD